MANATGTKTQAVKLSPRFSPKPHIYKPLDQIQKLAPSGLAADLKGNTYGFADPHFSFVHDHRRDWKLVGQSPRMWQFVGTSLILQVSPEVYLPAEWKKMPDVLAPIKQHEALHVQDAKTILGGSLQTVLKKDATFKKYFIGRQPIPETTYRYMFPQKMQEYVAYEFTKLWNTSVNKRDTRAEIVRVSEAVDKALRKRHP